jgi:hypothetical protein
MYDHGPGCWVYRLFICGRCLATTYGWWIRVWWFGWRVWFYRGRSNFDESINKYFSDDFYGFFYYDLFDYFNWSVDENLFDNFNRFFY